MLAKPCLWRPGRSEAGNKQRKPFFPYDIETFSPTFPLHRPGPALPVPDLPGPHEAVGGCKQIAASRKRVSDAGAPCKIRGRPGPPGPGGCPALADAGHRWQVQRRFPYVPERISLLFTKGDGPGPGCRPQHCGRAGGAGRPEQHVSPRDQAGEGRRPMPCPPAPRSCLHAPPCTPHRRSACCPSLRTRRTFSGPCSQRTPCWAPGRPRHGHVSPGIGPTPRAE